MPLEKLAARCPGCAAGLASQGQDDEGGPVLSYACGAVGLLSAEAAKAGRLWEVRWSRMCPAPERTAEAAMAERLSASDLDPSIDPEAAFKRAGSPSN